MVLDMARGAAARRNARVPAQSPLLSEDALVMASMQMDIVGDDQSSSISIDYIMLPQL